ncbi:MAG: SDR family oxidoreductase [Candidatus Omnitrophica bacterium]|nr:SDR family oxidoreductase [Candidatus Omnitrophota bacterium]
MSKRLKFQGVALVTGGAKRIGKSLCLSLSAIGYKIALHYNTSGVEAQRVADTIRRNGGTCELFPCDLCDSRQTSELIPRILKKFSRLNVLINNASVFDPATIMNFDGRSLDRHFAVNFKAPYVLTACFAKLCKKGNIVNLLDAHIIHNKTSYTNYLLSKKALCEFTKLSAVELAPHIRVNGIAPGLIFPPIGAKSGYLEGLAKKVPLKRKGDVTQIAQSVKFLLDNPYLTGQIIFNDGGEHLI